MRSWKWPPSSYRGNWDQSFGELQAFETFKKKLLREGSPTGNLLSLLIDCFHSYEATPSPAAYSFVFRYLFRHRLVCHLPPILDHLEKVEKIEIPENIFVDIINHYGRAGMIQDAVDVFFRMPKIRCAPSVVSLNTLLLVLCKKKEGLALVRDVLVKTPDMNIRLEASTFWILVRVLCRNGKMGSAVELMNMMPFHECYPDERMYSLVLHSLCTEAGSAEVMDFLEEMRNAGFLPDILEYNSVLDVLVREGKVEDAYNVLTQMKLDGRRPNVACYNRILWGFNMASSFQKVDELFDEMLLVGLCPDRFTYNTYINCLCKKEDIERASRMVMCMERAGCNPDVETYNIIMDGYIKAGQIRTAREMISTMRKKGLQWNSQTYIILIDGFLSEGQMIEAYQLLMEMLCKGFAPGPSTFSSLIRGLTEKGHFHEASKILMEMVSRSVAPDAKSWRALLDSLQLTYLDTSICLEGITILHKGEIKLGLSRCIKQKLVDKKLSNNFKIIAFIDVI